MSELENKILKSIEISLTESEQRVLDNLKHVTSLPYGSFYRKWFFSTNKEPVTKQIKSLVKKGIISIHYAWNEPQLIDKRKSNE